LAWISCSKCRKTKLLILADPPPAAKRVLLHPRCPGGRATGFRMVPQTTCLIARSCHIPQALFFRTGFEREPRISNPSNRIEATGFGAKNEFRWPRVPLLLSFPPA
jgi:hypothetical protein